MMMCALAKLKQCLISGDFESHECIFDCISLLDTYAVKVSATKLKLCMKTTLSKSSVKQKQNTDVTNVSCLQSIDQCNTSNDYLVLFQSFSNVESLYKCVCVCVCVCVRVCVCVDTFYLRSKNSVSICTGTVQEFLSDWSYHISAECMSILGRNDKPTS